MIAIAREMEQELEKMDVCELVQIFSRLEEIRFGIEHTFGVVIGGHSFCCNTHRQDDSYVIDGKSVTEEEFFELRTLVDLELKGTHSLSIHIRPPHKRRPGQTGPDGIILIPESLLGEEE